MGCVAFNQSLENVNLPSGLQSFFVHACDESLDNVTLLTALQSLTIWDVSNQSLDDATLPIALVGTASGPMAKIHY